MFSKINFTPIIKDPLSTLKNKSTGKAHLPDYFIFLGLPFLLSIVLINFEILLNKDFVKILTTSFSIFAGLLLNLLLLVFDISDKESNKDFKKYLREIYINISFCILVSITVVIFLLISFVFGFNNSVSLKIISFIVYYPLFVFILTLLMVLKRIYLILARRFKDENED